MLMYLRTRVVDHWRCHSCVRLAGDLDRNTVLGLLTVEPDTRG